MELLAFKLVLAPLLLVGATLAVRRWGQSIGGLLVGLPLTSGPISLFLALERGPEFATQATSGSLIATAAQAAFGLAYCRLARHGSVPAFAGGCAAFAGVAIPLQYSGWSRGVLFAAALAAVAAALRFSPPALPERRVPAAPWWDLPARLLLMVSLVVGVTAIAPGAGPQASGVIASFPFMGAILTVFAHRMVGPGAAQAAMRGMVAGLFGFGVFFYVLSLLLPHAARTVGYACAAIAALIMQGLVFHRLR